MNLYFYIIIGLLFFSIITAAHIYIYRKRTIKLPPNFIMNEPFVKNVIKSLNKIYNCNEKNISLDFSDVNNITEDSMILLFAQLEKAKNTKAKKFKVTKAPKSLYARTLLTKTYDVIHKDDKIQGIEYAKKIDGKRVEKMVQELRKIGISNTYQPFYDLLIEFIGNAIEHGIKNKNINWWIYRYKDNKTKTYHYVFLDMGKGIINSYKKSGLSLNYLLAPNKIPLHALQGKIGSSTKKPGRGNGMPFIMENIEKEWISNFCLITNGVSLRYINGEFLVSKNPNFVGTYYSWTINKENYNKWKSTNIQ